MTKIAGALDSVMLEAALAYAEWYDVFPCAPDKTPMTENGFHDATRDEEQIHNWWGYSTIGACIGLAIPAGVIVLDVDPRNGGLDTMRDLKRAAGTGAFPRTLTAKTGGGGFHYWYGLADPEMETRAHFGDGIDVKRAGRGYVIAPPSVARAGAYTWKHDVEIANAPEWMVEALRKPDKSEQRVTTTASGATPTIFPFMKGTAYGERALELEVAALRDAAEGGRNDALNAATFSLAQLVAGGELREDAVLEDLADAALEIGLEPDETEKTMASAFAAGLLEPRNAPERPDTAEATVGSNATPASILELLDAQNGAPGAPDESRFWVDWTQEVGTDPFILWPLLPRNAYVLVYGPTEAAKSMVMNRIGAEASCRDFTVSVYSLENPTVVDVGRLQRMHPCRETFRLSNELLNLADPAQALAMMERERGRDLVIIDTYSHAYQPRYDSGDGNAKAIEFARVIRWLMHHTGATFVVVDHTGFERSEEPRDASAKRQQVDVAIGMERTRSWQLGQPAHIRMTNYKAARFANPFSYDLRVVGNGDEALTLDWSMGSTPLEWGDA